MDTAHRFHSEGGFSTGPDEWVSDEEWYEHWEKEGEELFRWAKASFPRGRNLEFAILKGHLIVERALGYWIRSNGRVLLSDRDLRLSFRQKIEIAYLMGFGANDPMVLPTVEHWNSIRNSVAHSFDLDRAKVDELIRVNSEDYDDFDLSTDQQRITRLRNIAYFICGRVVGEMSARNWFDTASSDAYFDELETEIDQEQPPHPA